jgi:hypothetical protein
VNEAKFSPVAFDPKGYATKRRKIDPKFVKAYDALDDEFAALAALLKARTAAGLTQARGIQTHGCFTACSGSY